MHIQNPMVYGRDNEWYVGQSANDAFQVATIGPFSSRREAIEEKNEIQAELEEVIISEYGGDKRLMKYQKMDRANTVFHVPDTLQLPNPRTQHILLPVVLLTLLLFAYKTASATTLGATW